MGSHPVYAWRVDCPIRGSLDVDRCFVCPRFEAVVPSSSGFAIRCDAPPSREGRRDQGLKGGFVLRG